MKTNARKISHISTVHQRTDTRIFVKELSALREHFDGRVLLLVQDGLPDETVNGIDIKSAGPKLPRQRHRAAIGIWRMLRLVLREKPEIVHFHDPELIPIGFILKLFGKKIVYDVHEDVPKQLMHSGKMPSFIAVAVGRVYLVFEWLAMRTFDACVVVVPAMQERFSRDNTILLANFPSLAEFPAIPESARKRVPGRFVYVGGIVGVRGINEMVEAIALVGDNRARLHLLGAFNDPRLEARMRALDGWQRVNFLGWSSRETVVEELSQASAGLVVLHPTPQYVISYPVKMFEYMAAGLPVIASDFPLWREIVEGAGCGLLVDPKDPQAIAEAMQWILDHPEEAAAMGRRGRAAVEERYNWKAESEKLIALYRRLMSDT